MALQSHVCSSVLCPHVFDETRLPCLRPPTSASLASTRLGAPVNTSAGSSDVLTRPCLLVPAGFWPKAVPAYNPPAGLILQPPTALRSKYKASSASDMNVRSHAAAGFCLSFRWVQQVRGMMLCLLRIPLQHLPSLFSGPSSAHALLPRSQTCELPLYWGCGVSCVHAVVTLWHGGRHRCVAPGLTQTHL